MNSGATPRIVFRTDASLEIGTGHVMRCLTLAETLRARGAACAFVCRELPGHRIDEVRRRGFDTRVLAPDEPDAPGANAESAGYGRWLGVAPQVDAAATLQVLREGSVDWLVVDHYALDHEWEHALRPAADRVLVIDDLADRRHDCDLLLDQNLGSTSGDYRGLVPDGCALLCGPEFALLRPEFAQLRARSLADRASRTLARILVSMGGVDQANATGQVLDALAAGNLPPGTEVTIIMGSAAPWLGQVRAQAEQLRSARDLEVEIAVDVADMAARMAASDFAIGAAGSTSWERCCMGLPAALVVLADNQARLCRELAAAGAAFELGTPGDIARTLPPVLDTIAQEPGRLADMSVAAAAICDGHGAEKVARAMLGAAGRPAEHGGG
jgi:UDP-2,4-diacetamido-2,4,6-trideoxy-beta-L-altropyranose hydrolase